MRQFLLRLLVWGVIGIFWTDPVVLIAQTSSSVSSPNSATDPAGYQWTNAGVKAPGWQSQYPMSAQTTQSRPSFSSTTPFGINTTSGLTSNGENLRVAEGTLLRTDPKGQRLWIRTAEEKEMEFHYTSATQILGAGARVEGLVGTRQHYLRVRYANEGGRENAVQIEVQPGDI